MISEKIVITYGRTKKGLRVRCWKQPADWNALGITLAETKVGTFRAAVARAKEYAAQYGAEFSEEEMKRYFGV